MEQILNNQSLDGDEDSIKHIEEINKLAEEVKNNYYALIEDPLDVLIEENNTLRDNIELLEAKIMQFRQILEKDTKENYVDEWESPGVDIAKYYLEKYDSHFEIKVNRIGKI